MTDPSEITAARAGLRPGSAPEVVVTALDRMPPAALVLLVVALLALIGALDRATGPALAFGVFYLAPVALAAWYLGRGSGFAAAAAAALVWMVANRTGAPGEPPLAVHLWNTATWLAIFASFAALVLALHRALAREGRLVRTDLLTGTSNARTFYERATVELNRARRYGRPFTAVYLDLDDFKALNQRSGHAAGDAALRLVGLTLQQTLRRSDLLGRLGGDEFAVLLPETGADDGRALGVRLHDLLTRVLEDGRVPLGVSMAVVSFERAPVDLHHLMNEIDGVMYQVKRTGKNRMSHHTVTAP